VVELSETQIDLMLACLESDELLRWLDRLARESEGDRKRLLGDVIGKMRRDRVDDEIIAVVTRLLHPAVFAAFLKTVYKNKDVRAAW